MQYGYWGQVSDSNYMTRSTHEYEYKHRSRTIDRIPIPKIRTQIPLFESQTPIQTFSIFHESEYRHNLTSESNPAQGSNSVSIFKLYLHTFEVLSLLYLLLLSVFAIFKIVGVLEKKTSFCYRNKTN